MKSGEAYSKGWREQERKNKGGIAIGVEKGLQKNKSLMYRTPEEEKGKQTLEQGEKKT